MREVDKGDSVECRPSGWTVLGGGVVLLFVLGVVVLITLNPSRDDKPVPLLLAILGSAEMAAFAWFGLYMVLFGLRTRVIADEVGIRWRGAWHGWRSARWENVEDFYLSGVYDLQTGRRIISPIIVSRTGVLHIPVQLSHLDELKQAVQERATAARVSEWEMLGVRRVDTWPWTFNYWNNASPRKAALHLLSWVAVLALVAFGFTRLITWYTGLSTLAEASSLLLPIGISYAVLLLLPAWAIWRYVALWKRRGEQFTVTPETLRYANTKTGAVLEVAWSEISDYFYRIRSGGFKNDGYTLMLKGADETQINWTRNLSESALLLAIVQRYAPPPENARRDEEGWRNKSPHEATGSDPATWQGGAVGMGGRVFTQKSTVFVGLLVTGTLFVLFLVGFGIAEWFHPGVKDARWFMIYMTAAFALPTVWGSICLFRTRAETDDMGITHYTPFGKTYLPWFAVADYKDVNLGGKPFDLILVKGQNGKRMRLYSTLNGYEELHTEIERYAPLPKTGWKTPKRVSYINPFLPKNRR